MPTLKQKAKFAIQLTYDTSTGTGSYIAFTNGPLTQNPAIITFDNQSSVAVTISDDGVNDGKTFAIAEAMVLDMRTNGINTQEFTFPIGTQFYAKSAAGTGLFYISYVYAE